MVLVEFRENTQQNGKILQQLDLEATKSVP
jgi:hypothetical protein